MSGDGLRWRAVRRVAARMRVFGERGGPLGGPGPSPTGSEPARVSYRCGPCNHVNLLAVRPITEWLLAAASTSRAPSPLPGCETAGRQPPGFDGVCSHCGRPYRLLCEAGEWGRSGTPFPRFVAVLEVDRD